MRERDGRLEALKLAMNHLGSCFGQLILLRRDATLFDSLWYAMIITKYSYKLV